MTEPPLVDRRPRPLRRRDRPVPGWLARRGTRRVLALAAAVPFVCAYAAALFPRAPDQRFGPGTPIITAGLVVWVVCWLLLRRATTTLVDASDHALDEREHEERGRVFRLSYVILSVLVTVVTVTGLFSTRDELELPMLLTGLMLTTSLVPSAVTAWRWRDAPR